VHDVDIACLHIVEGQCAAQHEGAQGAAFHRDRLALEITHRPHAGTAYDHVGAVGHVHHQNDPRLKSVRGESEQLVEADDHAVDRLVAKRTQDIARRWIFHELYDRRIELAQLPRQVKRFAPYPDVGTDAQRGFRLACNRQARRPHAHKETQSISVRR
jgi:hypothetical protein